MYIKKVVEYTCNYAEYIVTDGEHDVKCVCASVPLPDGREPRVGMEITKVYAFSVEGVIVKKLVEEKERGDSITKRSFDPLGYKIRGKIIDSKRAIIKVYNYTIDLEYDYPNGLVEDFENGDFVEFLVDRLDCIIENYY